VEHKKSNGKKRAGMPWAKPNRKVLWGKEFTLVKSGLDVEQVADLVSELLAESTDGVSPLPEVTMEDTERQIADIKTEAVEEAQAEAEKIVKKVQEDAEEMKRRAEEGENAFAEIRKRAEAMEEESKKKTLVYLVKAREQIAVETKKEYEEARSHFEAETKKEYEEARSRFEAETKKEYEEARSRFEAETKKEYEEARSRFEAETKKEYEEARSRFETQTKEEYEEARSRFEMETKKEYEEARSRFEAETKKEYEEARSRFEAETKKEYEEARSRLHSSMQELINAEQDLEADLGSKRKALMESQYSKLVETMSNVLEVPAAGMSDIESATGAAAEARSDVAEEEETEPMYVQRQEKVEEPAVEEHEEVRTEIEEQPEETVREEAKAIETEEPPQLMEKLEETLQELGETIHELEGIRAEKPLETQEEEAQQEIGDEESEPVRAKQGLKEIAEDLTQTGETAEAGEVEEPAGLHEEVEKGREPLTEKAEEDIEKKAVGQQLDADMSFSGEVEMIIAPPAELELVSRLYIYLQTFPDMRVLYASGSWNQGTKITVVLEKPQPLLHILSQVPEMKVSAEPETRVPSVRGNGKKEITRIKLILAEI
jgi:hypothetical protein